MHDQFADWYQPATFGHDRDTIELRWKAVASIVEEIDVQMIAELTRLVFGKRLDRETTLDEFRKYFKEVDQTFQSVGNEEEIIVLAGCVLAALCDRGSIPVLLSILTTSTFGLRKLKVDIDLVKMAEYQLNIQAAKTRHRQTLTKLKTIVEPKEIKDAVQTITDNPDPGHVAQSLKILAPFYQQLVYNQQKVINIFNKSLKQFEVQDEELQILWWIISGWSNMWSTSFEKLHEKVRPILLAKEISIISHENTEPPSIKAIFSRVGIQNGYETTIPDAVTACGVDLLKKIKDSESCPILFPLHFAVARAIETNAKETWVSAWSEVTGIGETASISMINLAMQMYRECKLLGFYS